MAREEDEDDEDELESSLASAFALGAGLFGAAMLALFGTAMLGGGLCGAVMLAISSSYFLSSIASTPFFAPLTSCKANFQRLLGQVCSTVHGCRAEGHGDVASS